MTFNIRSPENPKQLIQFKPGLLLWLFTCCFLPLFIILGFWQLNRANEKTQLLHLAEGGVLLAEEVDWNSVPLYRDVQISGQFVNPELFFLDNKTFNGQFGYEVWRLLNTHYGSIAVSLGWVAGSHNRDELPVLQLQTNLIKATLTLRTAPKNPLFDVGANIEHASTTQSWVVQTLSESWIKNETGEDVIAFAQLLNTKQVGVGPNIWKPTVMTPAKHLGYALQWFSMAAALLGMFLYAGFKPKK